MRRLYSLAADLAGPPLVLAAVLKGRFGGRWPERLGLKLASARRWNRPRFWFHGASVGEARSAASVIHALLELRPDIEIFLSVGTPAGLKAAEDIFADERRVTVMASPLDFWGSPRRALTRVKPDALIIMETELWPNLVYEANKAGIKLILAAARLSDRSFKGYGLIKGFISRMLKLFDLIAPAGPQEAEFYQALGAPADRLRVLGNPKFDDLLDQPPDFLERQAIWAKSLGLDGSAPLIVAGSTHHGEEEFLLDALNSLSGSSRLLLAPRHLSRTPEVVKLADNRDFSTALASEPLASSARVVVLDSVGHLPAIYALAEVAVVGGSLRPGLAGHNPLEPAAVGRPIIFGPWMSSFAREAEGLLRCGGAQEVTPEQLGPALDRLLSDPEAARAAGTAAHDYLAARPKAAPALATAVLELTESGRPFTD